MKTKDLIQDEALKAIGDKNLSGIVASMGVGKTLLGLKHQAKFYTDYIQYLVVAPRRKIFQSWIDEAKKHNLDFTEQTDFSTYVSLHKQPQIYDIIYLDECHSLKLSHKEYLAAHVKRGGKIVGLTGTYPVNRHTEKFAMCNHFCPKVYEYDVDEAVEDKILNDYRIYVHQINLDTNNTVEASSKSSTWYTSELKTYNYWTERLYNAKPGKEEQFLRIQRMRVMQKFPFKEEYAKKLFESQTDKTIIFANTQAQADRLCEHSVHSKNKESDNNLADFKAGNILKLSAVEQLSEGVTIPDLKVGIIMHSYGNNRKASQKIGRLLRLNPNDTAHVHILCYVNSVDKNWVQSSIKHLDQSKIKWI